MAEQKRKINILSLVGFILAVFSAVFITVLVNDSSPIRRAVPIRVFDLLLVFSDFVLPAIVIVLSICGIKICKKKNEKGKGFAIAAIVISALEIVVGLCSGAFLLLFAGAGI